VPAGPHAAASAPDADRAAEPTSGATSEKPTSGVTSGVAADVAVIGGGIVGLATASAVLDARPDARVVVLDKEPALARHQTGRNSGVVHSGIYYPPGSHKARMCIAGNRSIVEYARAHGIAVEVTGKLIVATRADELAGLDALYRRGLEHGLEVRRLDAAGVREHEPHVGALAAVHVASTGIIDFVGVAESLAASIRDRGGEVRTGAEVTAVVPAGAGGTGRPHRITTTAGDVEARRVVNCAGLHSDRVAEMAGERPPARIIPFRGEYFELRPAARHLVRGLVYPVPDPDFPFLGVHLTRGTDRRVHAGPNAVLALRREGYRWRDVDARDLAETLRDPGLRRLARRHLRQGALEIGRSAWKPAFVAALRRLVPEITGADLVRTPAGVRAQAILPTGDLVDDFLFVDSPGALHVLNSPSPAATSSLEIGREIAARLDLAP
jgi:L-2-hydroxyglutarate oxidase